MRMRMRMRMPSRRRPSGRAGEGDEAEHLLFLTWMLGCLEEGIGIGIGREGTKVSEGRR